MLNLFNNFVYYCLLLFIICLYSYKQNYKDQEKKLKNSVILFAIT